MYHFKYLFGIYAQIIMYNIRTTVGDFDVVGGCALMYLPVNHWHVLTREKQPIETTYMKELRHEKT